MTLIIRPEPEEKPKRYFLAGSAVTITFPDGSTEEFKLSDIRPIEYVDIQLSVQ